MDERTDGRRTFRSAELVFERHYYDYQLALREVQTEAARRVAEIQERFSDAIQRAYRDWSDSAQEAYDRYLEQARAGEEDDAAAQEAYRDYVLTWEKGQDTARRVSAESADAFQRAMEEAQDDVCDGWDAAFRDYVADVRGSWGALAVENVTSASIFAIAQTMIAAAASAASAERLRGPRVTSFDQPGGGEGEETP